MRRTLMRPAYRPGRRLVAAQVLLEACYLSLRNARAGARLQRASNVASGKRAPVCRAGCLDQARGGGARRRTSTPRAAGVRGALCSGAGCACCGPPAAGAWEATPSRPSPSSRTSPGRSPGSPLGCFAPPASAPRPRQASATGALGDGERSVHSEACRASSHWEARLILNYGVDDLPSPKAKRSPRGAPRPTT
jgi:hypothetical protein